jgi:hypothetical protein
MLLHRIATAAFASLLFCSCASTSTTVHVKSEAPHPGDGTLEVTMADEVNTRVELHMSELGEEAPSYVVWAVPADPQRMTAKLGALAGDGSFEGTIPLTDFWLIVTAERTPAAVMPSGDLVITAEIRREKAS